MLFNTIGTVVYEEDGVKAYVDNQIGEYYRSFVPEYLYVKPQRLKSHLSIVRYFECPNKEYWGKYEGIKINIKYNNTLYFDKNYVWLNAWSKNIGSIREELGLTKFRMNNCYHITIGNFKTRINV